jgi:chromosome segregation ATPase
MAAARQSSMGFVLLVLLASAVSPSAAVRADTQRGRAVAVADAANAANPIRKVVTMLQKMQKDVTEEGEKEKELFDKFMCYCKTSGGDLEAAIGAAETKIPALGADIEKSEAKLAQTKEDLTQAQNDRAAAKTAMAEATSIREKEASAFASTKAELDADISSVKGAVTSLEKGMVGAFLQTGGADILRKLVLSKQDMLEEDRQQVLAFISGKQGSEYTPSSGQVTGILKDMGDQFEASLKDATATETDAIKTYDELMSAKTKEVNALSASIEAKSKSIGELSVSIAMMKNDLTDTEEALLADKEFLAGLDTSCKTKSAEWDIRVKTRADELVTLADAIKVLNDDDALELFKKTLPGASSFVQVESRSAALRAKALAVLMAAAKKAPTDHLRLDFVALALRGKQAGFEKVIGMIDTLVSSLKEEQLNDDNKKEYCATQLDFTDDKKKSLERTVSDESAAISSAEEGIATTADEIAALEAGIKELDKSVAEATAQRKAEHEEFSAMMASNTAAKELMVLVKNRLNKFYNPKLYKAPPKRVLSDEDQIVVNMGGTLAPTEAPGGIAGTGITYFLEVSQQHSKHRAAPPPPPETYGAYTKKSGETTGVMKLMDMLIADLDKEMTEGETEEEDGQKDYESLMKSSALKRAADSKVLTEKESAKASLEGDLEMHKEGHKAATKELAATLQYIHALHTECDWLMKYFDVRKEARDSEIDALGKAKAVLSGADYSLLQARSFLGRRL